jgi:hypothetical protein
MDGNIDVLWLTNAALPVVEKLHPKAVLIGHKNTLDRIETSLQKQALERDTEISVGNLRFNALVALGHTDGHMVLWDPLTRFYFSKNAKQFWAQYLFENNRNREWLLMKLQDPGCR